MTERSRASRFAVFIAPDKLMTRSSAESLWHESPDEVEAGLQWGEEKARLLKWVRRQMARRLTKREQQCIELYYFEGLNYRDAADRTGTNASSVFRAVRRAVRKLHASAAQGEGNLVKVMPKVPRFRMKG